MKLIHVFQEDENCYKRDHIKYWLGYPLEDDEVENSRDGYVVCHCGGKLVPLERNDIGETSIGAIWHLKAYKEYDRHYDN